jgi:hypothetical protein
LSRLTTLEHASWTDDPWADDPAPGALDLVKHLEHGDVLFFPRLRFPIRADEASLFSPAILSTAKNASFDPESDRVGGAALSGPDRDRLRGLMSRFSVAAAGLAGLMLPHYRARLTRARASFRPAEIAGRASSWRKDDTRLHVDSFPASPVQGRRILRLFTNVNPAGRPRAWRVGGSFETLATRFSASLALPWPGSGVMLRALRITKSLRTPYDALMLQLHDLMKADLSYQESAPQTRIEFPAGTTWMAFTDQVSHAATAGQYQLEQTFLLPVDAMLDESLSPLRVLERQFRRALV